MDGKLWKNVEKFWKKMENESKKTERPVEDGAKDGETTESIMDYINKVKENYQDLNNYYNFVEQNGEFNFSQCPFCDNPVIYKLERVLCINKCFITAVPEETFDKNYTLSNFMEQYKEYYSKHLKCKSDLMTLYVDKESKCAEFLCYKCEKNYIDFN